MGALFAALVSIFGKIGLQGIDPTLATTIRAVIMAIFLVVASFVFGKIDVASLPHGRSLVFIVLSGIAGALSWLAMFSALKRGPVAGVSAVDHSMAVISLLEQQPKHQKQSLVIFNQ